VQDIDDVKHPLVFFVNGLGDHLLALPALRALAKLFPRRLRLACASGARWNVFADVPLTDAIELETATIAGTCEFDFELARKRIGPCDLFLSLVPWHSESMHRLLAALTSGSSIGYHPDFRIALPLNYAKHSSELAFDLPRRIDATLTFHDFVAPPRWPMQASHHACRIRRAIPAGFRVVAVHVDTKPEKMWRDDRWIAFLDAILERFYDIFVLVVGRQERQWQRALHCARIFPCHALPVAVSFALVGLADIFIGVDSAMLHAADLCRVPGVGLFGPTSSTEFGFRLSRHRHVTGNGSMSSIEVQDVIQAFEELVLEII
jgi:ADP-heptose:LPS heptosyltransferase